VATVSAVSAGEAPVQAPAVERWATLGAALWLRHRVARVATVPAVSAVGLPV